MTKTYDVLHIGRSSVDLYADDVGAPFSQVKALAACGNTTTDIYLTIDDVPAAPVTDCIVNHCMEPR